MAVVIWTACRSNEDGGLDGVLGAVRAGEHVCSCSGTLSASGAAVTAQQAALCGCTMHT